MWRERGTREIEAGVQVTQFDGAQTQGENYQMGAKTWELETKTFR